MNDLPKTCKVCNYRPAYAGDTCYVCKKTPPVIGTIKNCARCQKDHIELCFFPLAGEPVEGIEGNYTHWAMCPNKQQPILLMRGVIVPTINTGPLETALRNVTQAVAAKGLAPAEIKAVKDMLLKAFKVVFKDTALIVPRSPRIRVGLEGTNLEFVFDVPVSGLLTAEEARGMAVIEMMRHGTKNAMRRAENMPGPDAWVENPEVEVDFVPAPYHLPDSGPRPGEGD